MPPTPAEIPIPAGPPLTPRERDTLRRLYAYRAKHKVMPTFRELARMEGISHVSVHERIGRLVQKGYIAHKSGESRSIVLLDPADEAARLVRSLPGVLRELAATARAGKPVAGALAELAAKLDAAAGE